MNLGEKIKDLRKNNNLTQSQLAEIIGVSHQAVSLYEINKRQPDYETLKKIALYFNVSIDYLLGVSDYPYEINTVPANIPKELKELGVEYIALAKHAKDKNIPPEDVKKIIDIINNIRDDDK